MKIYAPVKDFNGVRNNVRFVNGVGETDNPQLIPWFESHGYNVEKCETSTEKPVEKCDESPKSSLVKPQEEDVELMGYSERLPDFDAMTPLELREWMKANGYGRDIKNIRDKEKLLKIIRG